jgi:hypothetical protein
LKKLKKQIDAFLKSENVDIEVVQEIKNENAVYPFSTEGRLLVYLLDIKAMKYEDYLNLQSDYTKRNHYLYTYELTSKSFGDWGEKRVMSLSSEFKKATKTTMKKIMPEFDGEFDLYVDGIKVEVKANRAAEDKKKTSLSSRAYLHSEAKSNSFKYHFEQVKPLCCDVFIFIGVCRDKLLYWVLSSDELVETKKISSQHRIENKKDKSVEVYEGQVFMTEEELKPFLVSEKEVLKTVKRKAKKK